VVERALEKEWDPGLVALYGNCTGSDLLSQIERAERWLKTHPGDAALLLALGKLCAAQSLWGKARSYLEASIALEPTRAAHGALAHLLERIGLPDEALRYNRRSIPVRPPQTPG
jgi:HemY protein